MKIEVPVLWVVAPCNDVVGYLQILLHVTKMEAAKPSEMLVFSHISTWRHNLKTTTSWCCCCWEPHRIHWSTWMKVCR